MRCHCATEWERLDLSKYSGGQKFCPKRKRNILLCCKGLTKSADHLIPFCVACQILFNHTELARRVGHSRENAEQGYWLTSRIMHEFGKGGTMSFKFTRCGSFQSTSKSCLAVVGRCTCHKLFVDGFMDTDKGASEQHKTMRHSLVAGNFVESSHFK
jgi:hypothetical protein